MIGLKKGLEKARCVLDLQVDILAFIQSICEGNFPLYVISLQNLIKWCAVHLYNLLSISVLSPELNEMFHKGYFVFQNTNSEFSLSSLDKIHEQNNKIIKGVGGATHLLNAVDESGLACWELCAHEISLIVSEFEETLIIENEISEIETNPHYEDTDAFHLRFLEDVEKLASSLVDNPFQLDTLTVLNNTNIKFHPSVFHDISTLTKNGQEQFERFWTKHLHENTASIKKPIKINSYNLPGNQNKDAEKDPVMMLAMITKLRDAFLYHNELVQKMFSTEIFGISQTLAKHRLSLYHGTKSSILKQFNTCPKSIIPSTESAIVIELSAMTRMNIPSWVKTLNDYARFIYGEIIVLTAEFQRCDIVADQYFKTSLKEGIRNVRGAGVIKLFNENTGIPAHFMAVFPHEQS